MGKGSGPFSKVHKCRMAVICHCLHVQRGELQFFPCCGWYHRRSECEGRFNGRLPKPPPTGRDG